MVEDLGQVGLTNATVSIHVLHSTCWVDKDKEKEYAAKQEQKFRRLRRKQTLQKNILEKYQERPKTSIHVTR